MTSADRALEGDGVVLHALLRYDSEESLCARAVPYVREGLDRGETVLAVVSADVEQVLRHALGDDAARVRRQAGDVSYGRLGAMFEGFRRFLADQRAAGVALRLLAQNDTVGSPDRMAAYLRFEAMANEVYRPYGYDHAACAVQAAGIANDHAEPLRSARSSTPSRPARPARSAASIYCA